jgi:hypothetical protein
MDLELPGRAMARTGLNGLVTLTSAKYNYSGNWVSSADGTFTR